MQPFCDSIQNGIFDFNPYALSETVSVIPQTVGAPNVLKRNQPEAGHVPETLAEDALSSA